MRGLIFLTVGVSMGAGAYMLFRAARRTPDAAAGRADNGVSSVPYAEGLALAEGTLREAEDTRVVVDGFVSTDGVDH